MSNGKGRSDGESSIFKGKDGRYHGYVSMGRKAGGKRDRRHVSAKTRKAVVAKVRALEKKRDAGITEASGRAPTVEQWMTHWHTTIAVQRVGPRTWRDYRDILNGRVLPAIGHIRLDRLQPEHLEDFYSKLLANGLSAGTVLKTHRVISRALHVAHRRGRVARNVARLVDPPRYRRAEVDPLSASEARHILEVAKSRRNTARWTVAFALGLRQGEALGLQWEHVDLEAGTLRVACELQRLTWLHGCEDPEQCGLDLKPMMRARRCPNRRGGGLAIREPKSEKSKRTVVLPGSLLDQLRTHREEQNAERETAGSAWIDWEGRSLVFARPDGKPIDPREDWGEWKELLATAGVRDARLHDARHTAATLLLQQGVHPRVVMSILGHAEIGLTLGTYSHVVPELSTEAARSMEQALWE